MPEALEQIEDLAAARERESGLRPPKTTDERRARADLRAQIARLERELAELFASAFPRRGIDWGVGSLGGPRVLDLGELERTRDALAARIADSRAEIARQAEVEELNRGLLERMIAEPERHRWVRVSNEDLGEAGCRHWHSRPRWGLLGMLLGWWRVRLSSGCPLAEGPRRPRSDDREGSPWARRALAGACGELRPAGTRAAIIEP